MKKIIFAAVMIAVLSLSGSAFAGQIVMDGSTTVLPFGQAAAEQFSKQNPDVKFSVSGTGTGNGFKSLADGSAHIANASRFIKDSEIKACMDKKVYPVPFAVALDCLVPVVHPQTPSSHSQKPSLRIFYSGKVTNWKQVGGKRHSHSSNRARHKLRHLRHMAGNDNGCRGKTRVTPKAQVCLQRPDDCVSQNKNAIGYEGMGYVSKSDQGSCSRRSGRNLPALRSGKYPLARYLYMFTNGWPEGDVLDFISYMQSPAGQKIVNSTGFVPFRK